VAGEVAAEEARIDREEMEAAQKEIAQLPSGADPQQAQQIQGKYRAQADARKAKVRRDAAPKHFERIVAERKLEIRELPAFSFMNVQVDRTGITDPQEQVQAFLKASYQIRTMEVDQISPILSDTVTNAHYIVKLIGKEEPTFEMMPVVEYHQRRLALERQLMYTSTYRWTSFQVQKRRNWKEK
jgi:hypothetical protein